MLANCLHDLAAIGSDGVMAVAVALFLAGLAGGVTHCAGMCAPFVIAQSSAVADRTGGDGVLTRLSGAALLPYHSGRIIGYATLGAASGFVAGAVSQLTGLRFVLAGLLLMAAILMAGQAARRIPESWSRKLPKSRLSLPGLPRIPFSDGLLARVGRLLAAPGGWNGVGLGLLLSGLPCGLLYAALAAAAATGSALAGAIAMLAFCLGTVPALVGVAMVGRFFLRRAGNGWRLASACVFGLNAVVLTAMAFRLAA